MWWLSSVSKEGKGRGVERLRWGVTGTCWAVRSDHSWLAARPRPHRGAVQSVRPGRRWVECLQHLGGAHQTTHIHHTHSHHVWVRGSCSHDEGTHGSPTNVRHGPMRSIRRPSHLDTPPLYHPTPYPPLLCPHNLRLVWGTPWLYDPIDPLYSANFGNRSVPQSPHYSARGLGELAIALQFDRMATRAGCAPALSPTVSGVGGSGSRTQLSPPPARPGSPPLGLEMSRL